MALSLKHCIFFYVIVIFDLVIFKQYYCTVTVNAPCPKVKPFQNFNLTAFAQGIWYHIARYANDWEKRGDCGYLEFTRNGNVLNFKVVDVLNKHISTVSGVIDYAKDATNNGIIVFDSTGFEGAEGTDIFPVYVLDVNYTEYAIGYECMYNKTSKQRHEYAWVLSKKRRLDDYSKRIVDKFLQKSELVKEKNLIWIHPAGEYCKTEP